MNGRTVKIISCILQIILCLGLVSCDSYTIETTDSSTDISKSLKEANKELTVWHIWTYEEDSNRKAFNSAIDKIAAEDPQLRIKIDVIETEIYKSKIRLAIATNELPDIFFSWGGGFSRPFVDSGKVLELFSYMDPETKGRLMENALGSQTYNGKVYGLPFMSSVIVLFANKEIFKQRGVELPQTYEDLVTAVKTFRKHGITPISVAEIELWPGMLWYDGLALKTAGAEKTLAVLDKKESFIQPEFRRAAEMLDELVDIGAFEENFMDVGYTKAIEPVIKGRIPMFLMGSWACSEFESTASLVRGKMVPLNFPSVKDGKSGEKEYIGGAVDCWMVSASTEDKTLTVHTAARIAEMMSLEGYRNGTLIPVWKISSENTAINPLMRQVQQMVQDADAFIPAWDTYLEAGDAKTHLELVAQLMSQSITPTGYIIKMQQINNREPLE